MQHEPFNAPELRTELPGPIARGLLAELRAEGATMLLVEQNARRTIDFCERSVVLAGGRIRASGEREELQRNPQVLHAYMGRQL